MLGSPTPYLSCRTSRQRDENALRSPRKAFDDSLAVPLELVVIGEEPELCLDKHCERLLENELIRHAVAPAIC